MKNIKSSKAYMNKKWGIFILTFPVFIYSLLSTINNVFGFDLTSGLMGAPGPVGAGYTVLIGSPIYLFYLVKALKEYEFSTPDYLELNAQGLVVLQRPKVALGWDEIQNVCLDNKVKKSLVIKSEQEIEIPLEYLDIEFDELLNLFTSYCQRSPILTTLQ